ncbi:hypothetical protein [Acetobacter nitrogenifigens]|uniref:hypothetical protein n=1 Tax=Acetobacter nitrogenifigens TaxID=285268 RepID=UPI0003FCF752|nr:hypothetical protein [Acetobacter nitrogenifigens]
MNDTLVKVLSRSLAWGIGRRLSDFSGGESDRAIPLGERSQAVQMSGDGVVD